VQRIENGVLVGKLMTEIRKRVLKVTNKPFTLDPGVNSLKNMSTQVTKDTNWALIAKELKKFNIKVSKDQLAKDGSNGGRQQIINVIEKL